MKKLILSIIIIFFYQALYTQNSAFDSLLVKICDDVKSNQSLTDYEISSQVIEKHLVPFLSNFDESQIDSVSLKTILRLQVTCKEFAELMDRMEGRNSKGDWQLVPQKPEIEANTDDCDFLFELEDLKHLENNGDTVHLDLSDQYWIDNFVDGTYSKLSVTKTGPCSFDIFFIESDNLMRKNLSEVGDKYSYQILRRNEEEKHFDMSLEVEKMDIVYLFKLYY